jgi:phosphohistidine phosphatase
MFKLFLLRHAQAANDFDIGDHERTLTKHGLNQAKNIAKHLPEINLALCSDAIRTKTTLETAEQAGLSITKIQYEAKLYNAPTGALLTQIQHAGTAENLLLVAHNPGIHQLAIMLNDEHQKNKLSSQLMYGYAPASLSVFECEIDDWKNIQPSENKLVDLIIPD